MGMSESKKGQNRVVVYPDWCKGCGICAAFCPKQVLAVGPDGKARVVNEEACVNCGFCEPHCPDFAIMVVPADANGRVNGQKTPVASKSPSSGAPPAPPASGGKTLTGDKEGRQ
jgi:2-oxoglutarate ferredoxin oxidoreductase subunit delta